MAEKRALLRTVGILIASGFVRAFLLAFEQPSTNVLETWTILTRKRLLVDIFLQVTRRLSLAFCEFASVDFEPWH